MDDDHREAFASLGRQVDGVRTELGGRIDTVHREFLDFKHGIQGPTDPPPSSENAQSTSRNGTPPLASRVTRSEEQIARILALQEAQSKEQGTGTAFLGYVRSRSGRKLALQVVTAVLVLAGYVDARLHRAAAAPSSAPLPAASAPR